MNELSAKPYELPAMVILSRWDRERRAPVVFPSKRDDFGRHKIFESERELMLELELMETLNQRTTIPYQIDVVDPGGAQAFMDELAGSMAREAAKTEEGVGLLHVYGFTAAQLAEMGLPTRKGETL